MRVKMNVAVSGDRDGEPWPPIGGELKVSDSEGRDLCAAGIAEPVAVLAKATKATAKKSEKR